MSAEEKATRRSFLSYAATAIIIGVVAGVGGYYAGLLGATPVEVTSTTTVTTTQTQPGGTATTTVTATPVTRTVTEQPVTKTVTITKSMDEEIQKQRQALYEAAKKEGALMVYTTFSVKLMTDLLDKFKEIYPGINTEFIRAGTAEIASRFLTEIERGVASADIIRVPRATAESYFLLPEKKTNILMSYVPLEAVKDYPKDKYDPDGYWINGSIIPMVVSYNTQLVAAEDIPKTMKDLLNPVFKGKIAFPELRYPSTIQQLLALEEAYGEEFIKDLAEQNPLFGGGSFQVSATQIARGEALIGLIPGSLAQSLVDQGEAIAVVKHADREYVANVGTWCIAANAPHPNAARLYQSYIASPDGGQVVLHKSGGYVPINPRTPIVRPEVYIENMNVLAWFSELEGQEYEDAVTHLESIFRG